MNDTQDKRDDRTLRIAGSSTLFLALALGLLMLLAWRLSDVLLLLFGAVILAVALGAVAAPLQHRLHLSQRVAVGVTVTLTFIVVTAGSWLVGDQLVEQANDLRERLPAALDQLGAWASNFRVGVALHEVWKGANTEDVPWASVANAATNTLGAIGSVGLLLVVGVYLAADPTLYCLGLVRLVPLAYRDRIDGALLASDPVDGRTPAGVEDAEPEAVADEGGACLPRHRIRNRAIGLPGDGGGPGEGLGIECAATSDGDRKAPGRFVDRDVVGDYPRPSRPIAVLKDHVHATKNLDVVEPDIAQLAVDVVAGEGAGSQECSLRRRRGCSVPCRPVQDRLPTV